MFFFYLNKGPRISDGCRNQRMSLHQMPGVGFRIGLCTFVCDALRDFAGLLSRDYLRGIRFPVAGCPIILF